MITNDEVRYMNLSNQAASLITRLETATAEFDGWKRQTSGKTIPITEEEWKCLYLVFIAARDVVTDERGDDRERLRKYVSDYQRFIAEREAETARFIAELKESTQ